MKLSTAFALLGAASTAFPGVSAHEVAALRGFLPENIDFLGLTNCGSLPTASDGCAYYLTNEASCASLKTNGCGCIWDSSISECVNDSCGKITNNNKKSGYGDAIAICESNTRDCTWNDSSNRCQNGGSGGGGNRSCNGLNFQNCRDTNGCTFIEPKNANSYCVSVVNAGNYCGSSQNNQSETKCLKAGCQWYGNGVCDIPCSNANVDPSYSKTECKKSGCSYSNGFCDAPNYVFDFEAALESSN